MHHLIFIFSFRILSHLFILLSTSKEVYLPFLYDFYLCFISLSALLDLALCSITRVALFLQCISRFLIFVIPAINLFSDRIFINSWCYLFQMFQLQATEHFMTSFFISHMQNPQAQQTPHHHYLNQSSILFCSFLCVKFASWLGS